MDFRFYGGRGCARFSIQNEELFGKMFDPQKGVVHACRDNILPSYS